MKLNNLNLEFDSIPFLTTAIKQDLAETLSLKDFDKDGFEIPAPLECEYYKANSVELNLEIQYHIAPVKPWYIDETDSEHGLVLDHCMLLQRYAFAGDARLQLEALIERRPIVQKLLGIKPKWGIDFSLDYVSKDIVMEVIHIEQDFTNLEEANEAKMKLENIIENTDWLDGAKQLIKRKAEWEHLSSDDHSDYKAQFFGWHRAFDTLKVFSA